MTQKADQTNALYFQAHGLTTKPPKTLNKALKDAIERMHSTLFAPTSDELTPAELAVLEQAGMDLDEHANREDPMMTYATEFGAILATSLSATQAAQRLGGITPVRIRQMIRDGTLYAIQIDGRWKIPIFQFTDKGLVPNIGIVNATLPRTLDAVSVLRWYTTLDPELATADDKTLNPLDWLKNGMDPERVVKLARDL
jgi:hypothetical protein